MNIKLFSRKMTGIYVSKVVRQDPPQPETREIWGLRHSTFTQVLRAGYALLIDVGIRCALPKCMQGSLLTITTAWAYRRKGVMYFIYPCSWPRGGSQHRFNGTFKLILVRHIIFESTERSKSTVDINPILNALAVIM